MKKLSLLFIFISLLFASKISFAQAYQSGWDFGFGLTYPRFYSTDVRPMQGNIGGELSLQRDFSSSVGLRALANYDFIEGRVPGNTYFYTSGAIVPPVAANMHTSILSGNLDVLYYLVPSSPVVPYMGAGLGLAYFKPKWPSTIVNPDIASKTTAQLNIILGADWKICDNWKINTEFGFHTIDGEVDGIINNNRQGILGSDADGYVTFNLGAVYSFGRIAKAKHNDMYGGVSRQAPRENYPTLEQIDSVVKNDIPRVIEKQVVVEKPVEKTIFENNNWVLFGVNFKTNSAELLPESLPILQHAIQVLKDNSDVKVEIQGYTDNVGKDHANQILSEKRANSVKNYLVKNGIDGSRLTAVGFGNSKPIGDNNTVMGKAENRRIEFKIIK
jgi:outer membrane protein OmpA-like peptidoglycan-associated protein/opacity protein-like surface antigen